MAGMPCLPVVDSAPRQMGGPLGLMVRHPWWVTTYIVVVWGALAWLQGGVDARNLILGLATLATVWAIVGVRRCRSVDR